MIRKIVLRIVYNRDFHFRALAKVEKEQLGFQVLVYITRKCVMNSERYYFIYTNLYINLSKPLTHEKVVEIKPLRDLWSLKGLHKQYLYEIIPF